MEILKSKYILSFFLIVIVIILSFYITGENHPEEEAVPEQVIPIRKPTRVDTLISRYDTLLSQLIDSMHTVGAAVTITYKGEILHQKCYGVKKAGKNDSIDIHTIFRLASVSKTISGIFAGILSNDRIIHLDDKVIDYLPGFKLRDSINTYELSIRNILSHTSGLIPHAYDNLVEAEVPFKIIIDSLKRVNIAGPPGKYYGYQNVVFSLLDTITEVRTLKSFEENLKEKIFIPFGMNDAFAGYRSPEECPDMAFPHAGRFGKYRTLRTNDRYYNTNPAAGINASISDMGQFLLALSGHDTSVLNPNVVDTVLTPQVRSPLKWNYLRRWDRVDSKQYALGWRIIGYKGRKVAYHGGYVLGYNAEIAFCKDEDIGIAFLTNSPNSVSSKSVPMFLNLFFEMLDAEKLVNDTIPGSQPAVCIQP